MLTKQRLLRLMKEGISQQRIAKSIGRSQQYVKTAIRRYGIEWINVRTVRHRFCVSCGTRLIRSKRFCDSKCQQQLKWMKFVRRIESTGECTANPVRCKRYLTETDGHVCQICGVTDWNGKPLIMILDHIDGNSDNWSLSNLRLVCSNCDSQLPTYKGRNYGKGRHVRRQRYGLGLSY